MTHHRRPTQVGGLFVSRANVGTKSRKTARQTEGEWWTCVPSTPPVCLAVLGQAAFFIFKKTSRPSSV